MDSRFPGGASVSGGMRTLIGRHILRTLLCGGMICVAGLPAAASPAPAPPAVRIERAAVESSSLVSIGFAREARVLEIEFRSGAIYRYLGVPLAVFDGLKKAESKGRYFAQSIRGKYEFQRVEAVAK